MQKENGEIRTLRQEDLDETVALDQFAFQLKLSPEEVEERRTRVSPDHMLGFFVDDRLAAKMTILPLHAFIAGKLFEMGGIASVATWPEHRRQGMVAKLLKQSLLVMQRKGHTISFLHPFSFAFYRKYGWETYVERKQYSIDVRQMPKDRVSTGKWRRENSWEILNSVYEVYAKRFNGTLQRTEHWWKNRIFKTKQGLSAVYYDETGTPLGYLLYEVKNKTMNIHELVFLDEPTRKAAWQFIRQHDSMIEQVTWKAPPDDGFPFLLENPRIKQEISPYFMARIVDVKAFVEQYPFQPAEPLSFRLTVQDPLAEWNNQSFWIELDPDGNAAVGMCNEIDSLPLEPTVFHLSCDIQTLTAALMGYQKPGFLNAIGRLLGEDADIQQLEKRIPLRTPYLLDYF